MGVFFYRSNTELFISTISDLTTVLLQISNMTSTAQYMGFDNTLFAQ